jgi:hypothetical protein
MKLSCSLLIAAQVLSVLALPAPDRAGRVAVVATTGSATEVASATSPADAAASTSAAAEVGGGAGGEAGAGEGAGEGEGAENEVEVQAQFGEVVELQGGDLKQDILYPPGVSLPLRRSSSLPLANT